MAAAPLENCKEGFRKDQGANQTEGSVAGALALGEELQIERQGRAFIAELFSPFAALGLGLAAFGVHGVVAHSAAERRE